MHVLHVNHSLDPVTGGGTAERTFRLARAMALEGAQCTVLTLDVGLTPERVAALRPARVVALPRGASALSRRFHLPRCSLRSVLQVVRAADAVCLMGHWTVLNALGYHAARRVGRPYVVGPAGALRIYGRSSLLKGLYNLLVGRRLVRQAAAHVAITAAERESFAPYGVDPSSVSIIPNGVDLDVDERGPAAEAVLPAFQRTQGRPVVLYVGRLNAIKGPDLLVEAFARVHQAHPHHLVLVGPDEGLRDECLRLAQRLGVADRVHLPGPLRGPDLTRAYRAASLLAVPSRHEAMSVVAGEAGLAGTPVLLTTECGFGEIEQAGGGLEVPATVSGLEEGLRRLLADPAQLPVMGARLRTLVLGRYTWRRCAAEYLRLLESLTPDHDSTRLLPRITT